jgi:hypothetical protein
MPVIRKEISVGANSTVDNVISGSIYEFMPRNAALRMGNTASATGLVVTINTGSDTVLEESPVNPTTNFPVIPDDMDVSDVAAAGERLVIRVRNTTAGALTLFSLTQIDLL